MNVTTFFASNPGLTFWISVKLRTISPAPISSTSDSVTSMTTSAVRSLLPRTPPVSLPRSRSPSDRFPATARSAGARPNTIAATSVDAGGEREGAAVDRHALDPRQVARAERLDHPDALPREREHREPRRRRPAPGSR